MDRCIEKLSIGWVEYCGRDLIKTKKLSCDVLLNKIYTQLRFIQRQRWVRLSPATTPLPSTSLLGIGVVWFIGCYWFWKPIVSSVCLLWSLEGLSFRSMKMEDYLGFKFLAGVIVWHPDRSNLVHTYMMMVTGFEARKFLQLGLCWRNV